MLPELRHVKELKGTTLPTSWSMKHATTRANVRITSRRPQAIIPLELLAALPISRKFIV